MRTSTTKFRQILRNRYLRLRQTANLRHFVCYKNKIIDRADVLPVRFTGTLLKYKTWQSVYRLSARTA